MRIPEITVTKNPTTGYHAKLTEYSLLIPVLCMKNIIKF